MGDSGTQITAILTCYVNLTRVAVFRHIRVVKRRQIAEKTRAKHRSRQRGSLLIGGIINKWGKPPFRACQYTG